MEAEKPKTTSKTDAAVTVLPPTQPPAQPVPAAAVTDQLYVIKPSGAWPPPIYVDPNATEQERHYIEFRWHSQWEWYDKRATDSKKRYQRIQKMIAVGSILVPALISFNLPDSFIATFPWMPDGLRVLTVLLSIVVAVLANFESIDKHGDNWRNFRGAAEELLREKALYDVKSGPYRKTKTPFLLFVQRSEEIMTKQNGSFLQLAEEVQQNGQQPAQKQETPSDDMVNG